MTDFSYGIITVSDRCHSGETIDESGAQIKMLLQKTYNAVKITQSTIPDEQEEIEKLLIYYSDCLGINCIITTGGTGCSQRDRTPEATKKVIEREFAQLAMTMLIEGLKQHQFAALSRAVCGIRKNTLIINFPGSKKAVCECFEAVKFLIPHAIELICGINAKTDALHKTMQEAIPKQPLLQLPIQKPESTSYSVQNDDLYSKIQQKTNSNYEEILKKPPIQELFLDDDDDFDMSETTSMKALETASNKSSSTRASKSSSSTSSLNSSFSKSDASTSRHVCPHKTASLNDDSDRNSIYPMVAVNDALQKIFNNICRIGISKEYKSPMNCPPFRASVKDGYAVKSSLKTKLCKVIGYISAGDRITKEDFNEDECYKINTGAAVPHFSDAIVQIEDTKLISVNEEGVEQVIELKQLPQKNLDIREIGSDLMMGETLFESKGLMGVSEKTLLASVGISDVQPKPKIAIISTGDELVDPQNGELQEGQIYDCNTTMLKLLCEKFGFDVKLTKIAKDNYDSLKSVMEIAMRECQVVISSGGVSMGDKDFVKILLIDKGYTIHFGRVNMKPGKPMTFATHDEGKRVFFALPGNPVSAFVCFHLFVLPALRYISGFLEVKCCLPTLNVILQDVKHELDERPEYVRARITYSKSTGLLKAHTTTSNQMSSKVSSLVNCDALINFPSRSENKTPIIAKGAKVRATIIEQFFVTSIED